MKLRITTFLWFIVTIMQVCGSMEWSNWNAWSDCTKTCNRGLSHRRRTCKNVEIEQKPTSSDRSSTTCPGPYRQYKICNPKDCPFPEPDYRKEQCEKYNRRTFAGRSYRWESFINPSRKCSLSCRPKGYSFYARVVNRVPDGIPCAPGSKDTCINGHCMKVGCDDVVGSGKVVDKCGVCGGNNQTCNIMKGFYTPTRLPKGYNTILTFPSGACNINVTEMKPSRNFLALKKEDDTYIFSGQWQKSSPGQYKTSGTVFHYNRQSGKSCRGECLHAQGPITEKLVLQLLAYDRNPGIFYEYSIPSGMVPKILHKMKNIVPPPRQMHPHPQAYRGRFFRRRPHVRNLPQFKQPKPHSDYNRTNSYWNRKSENGDKVIHRRPGPHYIPSYASKQAAGGSGPSSRAFSTHQQQSQSRINRKRPGYVYPRNDQRYNNSTLPHRNYLRYPAPRRRFNSTMPRGMQRRYSYKYPRLNSSSAARGRHGRQYLGSAQANATYSRRYDNSVFTGSNKRPLNRVPYRNSPHRPVLRNVRPAYNQPHTSGVQAQSFGSKTLSVSQTNTGTSDEEINYQWNIVGFTECTEPCGGGTQETRIVCVKMNSQVVVTDENCDPDVKLPTQSTACNTKPCKARWTPSEWSPCSVSCGEGKKTRHVECQEKFSPTFSKRVSATACLNQTRLPTKAKCVEKPCSQWVVKEWSKCTMECGLGLRTREVRCVGADEKVLTDRECHEPKPATSDVCDMGSCAKDWFFTRWSKECSASCGHGLLYRKVHCSADNGESIPDTKCKQNVKPKSEKPCKSERPCGGLWFTGPWSQCTATCGQGIKVRDVTCVKKLHHHSFTVVDKTNCLKEEKPATEELCEALPECPPEWYITEWTECSASCGTGYKTRETKCVDANLKQSVLCDIGQRPIIRQSCNTNSCLQIPLNTDPRCRDHMKQCKMVVQARLCSYPYYKQRCCETCRKHHHHHHHHPS